MQMDVKWGRSEQVCRPRRESGQRTTDGRSGSKSYVRISERYLTEGVDIKTAGKEIPELVYVRCDEDGCEWHRVLC